MPKNNRLVHRTKICLTVKNENADTLRELSDRTMIPQSKLVDKALELLFSVMRKEG